MDFIHFYFWAHYSSCAKLQEFELVPCLHPLRMGFYSFRECFALGAGSKLARCVLQFHDLSYAGILLRRFEVNLHHSYGSHSEL